jgi:hypothetical protein
MGIRVGNFKQYFFSWFCPLVNVGFLQSLQDFREGFDKVPVENEEETKLADALILLALFFESCDYITSSIFRCLEDTQNTTYTLKKILNGSYLPAPFMLGPTFLFNQFLELCFTSIEKDESLNEKVLIDLNAQFYSNNGKINSLSFIGMKEKDCKISILKSKLKKSKNNFFSSIFISAEKLLLKNISEMESLEVELMTFMGICCVADLCFLFYKTFLLFSSLYSYYDILGFLHELCVNLDFTFESCQELSVNTTLEADAIISKISRACQEIINFLYKIKATFSKSVDNRSSPKVKECNNDSNNNMKSENYTVTSLPSKKAIVDLLEKVFNTTTLVKNDIKTFIKSKK